MTPDKKAFEGAVERVSFPGIDGEFEVLSLHAPLVAQLGAGTIEIVLPDRKQVKVEIKNGFVEVLNNRLSVVAEGAA